MADALELRDNNLYANGRVIDFGNGESMLIRDKIVYVGKEGDVYHTVTTFDTLGQLAYKYYRKTVIDSSKYWWIIADVNNIYNPFELGDLVGQDILIPDILTIKLQYT